ncbi:hypothetical protein [Sphingomonas sp. CARO-RG-8B-R24-01]|uniref:hypothetical protein n=1 Tax=Sphingomonas sp. CARO-RG-8B-R24-01 TaxID=2914831 RepID=UPI001F596519|nr:hypothetical protein [Sphingomonas sp. CARO-RG-8B-R24-01]
MAVHSDSQRLILPVAPLVGALVGSCAAVVLAAVPIGVVETIALDSGIAAIVSAAAPPLGFTARLLMVVFGGGGLGVIGWFAAFLVRGTRSAAVAEHGITIDEGASREEAAPILRRADAHPDAPARRPLRADRDLGTPFLQVSAGDGAAQTPLTTASMTREPKTEEPKTEDPRTEDPRTGALKTGAPKTGGDAVSGFLFPGTVAPGAERALPKDLDVPLAAYRTEPVSARPQTFAPGERLETFRLKPGKIDPSESIHALLDRLEQVVQRPPNDRSDQPERGLEAALAELRSMALRAR